MSDTFCFVVVVTEKEKEISTKRALFYLINEKKGLSVYSNDLAQLHILFYRNGSAIWNGLLDISNLKVIDDIQLAILTAVV